MRERRWSTRFNRIYLLSYQLEIYMGAVGAIADTFVFRFSISAQGRQYSVMTSEQLWPKAKGTLTSSQNQRDITILTRSALYRIERWGFGLSRASSFENYCISGAIDVFWLLSRGSVCFLPPFLTYRSAVRWWSLFESSHRIRRCRSLIMDSTCALTGKKDCLLLVIVLPMDLVPTGVLDRVEVVTPVPKK
jgi:hypothetical protein